MTHLKRDQLLYKIFKSNRFPNGILIYGSEGCGQFKLVVKLIKCFFKKDILKKNLLPHPDIHFMYPLPKGKNKIDDIFIKFLIKKPYANLLDWKKEINSENIDLQISLDQVEYLLKLINIKSYELSHKIVIIWMSESLNLYATKKLVKILDSPITNVLFVFLSENENFFINNLHSIVYRINLNTLDKSYQMHTSDLLDPSDLFDKSLKNNFIFWMRLLFGLKNKIDLLLKLCYKINLWSRDKKKRFLLFSLEIFRIAHRYNYDKNYMNPFWYDKMFNWKTFCKYITTRKVSVINKLINDVIKVVDNLVMFLFSLFDLSF
ncbi:MAG: hypothetical protein ACEOLT_00335, partial [Candidatus Karelsulcia muelleri]